MGATAKQGAQAGSSTAYTRGPVTQVSPACCVTGVVLVRARYCLFFGLFFLGFFFS